MAESSRRSFESERVTLAIRSERDIFGAMPGVSNFLRRRNDGTDLEVRPVRRDEVDAAIRLIVAGQVGSGGDMAVLDFLRASVSRGLDLTAIWVAAEPTTGKLQWAVLPMMLAGRAMLLMLSTRLRPNLTHRHISEAIAGTLLEAQQHGVTLAQVLLDPDHAAVQRALVESGFEQVAQLVYLSRRVSSPIKGRLLPEQYRLWRYDRHTHFRFGKCIERTYIDSLDCPQLNGKRHMEDIIAGHKAAGEFDPELWMLLSDLDNNDLGVMLLNRLPNREGLELVYIGLTPEARGQGLADGLIRTAINQLASEGVGQLLTACDAANAPARKLYHRHGFAHLYARNALVKDLRPTTDIHRAQQALPGEINPPERANA